jgi:hypothetical protein
MDRRTFLHSVATGVVLTSVRPAGQALPRPSTLRETQVRSGRPEPAEGRKAVLI